MMRPVRPYAHLRYLSLFWKHLEVFQDPARTIKSLAELRFVRTQWTLCSDVTGAPSEEWSGLAWA
jgi:hypothetical protein